MRKNYNLGAFLLSIGFSIYSMDTPKPLPIAPEKLFKLKSEGQDIEISWQILKQSKKLRGFVEDVFDIEYIPLDDMSLKTTYTIFDFLKSYVEQSDEEKAINAVSTKINGLPLPELTDVANGASNLLLSAPILSCIGKQVAKLIDMNQNFNKSDYDAINRLDINFFKNSMTMTEDVVNGIKTLLLKKYSNERSVFWQVPQAYSLHGALYDENSLILSADIRKSAKYGGESLVMKYSNDGKKIAEHSINGYISCIASQNKIVAIGCRLPEYKREIIVFSDFPNKQCFLGQKHTREINKLVFNDSGTYLVSSAIGMDSLSHYSPEVYIWNIGSIDWSRAQPRISGFASCKCNVGVDAVLTMSFTSDNQLLIVAKKNDDIQLLRCAINQTQSALTCIITETKTLLSLRYDGAYIGRFSNDNNYFIFADKINDSAPYKMTLIDTQSAKIVAEWACHQKRIDSICFNSDNNWVICASDGEIVLYDLFSGALLNSLKGLTENNKIQCSNDDKRLLTTMTSSFIKKPNLLSFSAGNLENVGILNVLTNSDCAALEKIKSCIPSQAILLYRLLLSKNNKKTLQLSAQDTVILSSIDSAIKTLLQRVGLIAQSWGQWLRSFSWRQKAALGVGGAALGFALYKYFTQSQK